MPSAGAGSRRRTACSRASDSPLRAHLGVYETLAALMEGRFEAGIELADRTMAIARKLGNADALYIAMSFKGMAEVMRDAGRRGSP